jgi:hypothetical protein
MQSVFAWDPDSVNPDPDPGILLNPNPDLNQGFYMKKYFKKF